TAEARTLTGWDIQKEADRFVISQYAPPGVVINEELEIVQFRGQTGPYLEPAPGAASFNILKMAREGLWLPLRGALEEAQKQNRAVHKPAVRVKFNGSDRTIDLSVAPLAFPTWKQRFLVVLFEENAPRPEPDGQATAGGGSACATEERAANRQRE